MRRILLTLSAALALAIAVSACGGGSGGGSTSTSGSSTPSSAASSSSGGGSVAIKMQNIAFSPNSSTVKVGEKVTWTNDDSTNHNVTATSGADFKSKDFGNGGTFSFTPDKAGTIKYVCTIHPGMTGTLTVTG
jgi:plastocyanin